MCNPANRLPKSNKLMLYNSATDYSTALNSGTEADKVKAHTLQQFKVKRSNLLPNQLALSNQSTNQSIKQSLSINLYGTNSIKYKIHTRENRSIKLYDNGVFVHCVQIRLLTYLLT